MKGEETGPTQVRDQQNSFQIHSHLNIMTGKSINYDNDYTTLCIEDRPGAHVACLKSQHVRGDS